MQITISQPELARALSIVSPVANGKSSTLPVLANVLLSAGDGVLTLSATDLKVGATTTAAALILVNGSTTVDARQLAAYVATLPDDAIAISATDRALNLRCRRSTASFQTIDPDHFPLLPTIEGAPLATIPAAALKAALAQVVFAVSQDTTRGVLTGVALTFGDDLALVATDAYRLSVRRLALAVPVPAPVSLIVPGSALRALRSILPDDESAVSIAVSPNRSQVLFHLERVDFLATLLAEQFVNYARIIPKDHTTRVVVDTAELARAVRQVLLFSKDGSSLLRLSVGTDALTLHAETDGRGAGDSSVECVTTGDGLTIGFNSRYLADLLSAIGSPQTAIELTSPTHAGVFRPVEGADFLHVIMPVTVPR